MSIIDEYRRKLSVLQTENMNLMSDIADVEKRLSELKKQVTKLYEQIDEVLDMDTPIK